MSDTFTASNDVVIEMHDNGFTTSTTDGAKMNTALREFFLHERDKDLARWRWPEDQNFVVYPVGYDGLVDVLRENNLFGYGPGRQQGIGKDFSTHPENGGVASNFYEAARAYFAAHPEPRPWHDARNGQLWLIRFSDFPDTDVSALVKGGRFIYNDDCHEGAAALEDSTIVGGTQVWPEVTP